MQPLRYIIDKEWKEWKEWRITKMGFFQELKENLSQAVNELIPDDKFFPPEQEEETAQENNPPLVNQEKTYKSADHDALAEEFHALLRETQAEFENPELFDGKMSENDSIQDGTEAVQEFETENDFYEKETCEDKDIYEESPENTVEETNQASNDNFEKMEMDEMMQPGAFAEPEEFGKESYEMEYLSKSGMSAPFEHLYPETTESIGMGAVSEEDFEEEEVITDILKEEGYLKPDAFRETDRFSTDENAMTDASTEELSYDFKTTEMEMEFGQRTDEKETDLWEKQQNEGGVEEESSFEENSQPYENEIEVHGQKQWYTKMPGGEWNTVKEVSHQKKEPMFVEEYTTTAYEEVHSDSSYEEENVQEYETITYESGLTKTQDNAMDFAIETESAEEGNADDRDDMIQPEEAEQSTDVEKQGEIQNEKQTWGVSMESRMVASEETAIITAGMKVKGDISSEGSLDIVGVVEGNVDILGKLNITGTVNGNSKATEIFADGARITGEVVSEGSVKIGQSSVVIGNITATSAVIAGAVKGDIDVQGPVILDTSAIVMGNIKSKSVQINNGAVIEGMCSQCYAEVSPTSFFSDVKKSRNK